ncbi:MAG: hypothetical protein ACRC2R_16930 [Xenococcaceae cyanobacterium]
MDKLKALAQKDESTGLIAKRIVLEALGIEITSNASINLLDSLKEQINELQSKYVLIDEKLTSICDDRVQAATTCPDFKGRFEVLESKLNLVIEDRDRLLSRMADKDNHQMKELKEVYESANELNIKLEGRINEVEKANNSLEAQNRYLEQKLFEKTGIDISDRLPEKMPPMQLRELKDGYIIYWDEGIEIEKFWSGRVWTENLSKAKIYSAKGAISAIAQLNKKGAKATYESIGDTYDRLSDERQEIANQIWIKENG